MQAAKRLLKPAKQANAHEFISNMPDGYDTMTGERGARLLGGQRERLSIARAIQADPQTLILDKATSALDSRSERLNQEAIEKLEVNRTTLVIAHRHHHCQRGYYCCSGKRPNRRARHP